MSEAIDVVNLLRFLGLIAVGVVALGCLISAVIERWWWRR